MGILMGGVIRSAATHGPLAFASAVITQTIHIYSTDGNGIWNNLSDAGAYAYSGVSITASAGSGFHAKTVNMNNVSYYPELGINGLWEIIELTPAPVAEPTSCFAADTPVLLADGSSRRIADIMVGELVIGRGGSLNRVIGIERPVLGDRRLYALDGGRPFVTAEHPFLTSTGWRSIDPDATAVENADLLVERLRVGDRIQRVHDVRVAVAAGGGLLQRAELALVSAPLHSLTWQAGEPDQLVYNLLLDGDHTYVAAGYLVHNKTSH